MIKLINALTGTDMYVPEARLPEYLSAGHRIADGGENHDELRDTGRSDDAGETAGTVGSGEGQPAATGRKRKSPVRSKAAK